MATTSEKSANLQHNSDSHASVNLCGIRGQDMKADKINGTDTPAVQHKGTLQPETELPHNILEMREIQIRESPLAVNQEPCMLKWAMRVNCR